MRVWRNWQTHQILAAIRHWSYSCGRRTGKKLTENLICVRGEIGRQVGFGQSYFSGDLLRLSKGNTGSWQIEILLRNENVNQLKRIEVHDIKL